MIPILKHQINQETQAPVDNTEELLDNNDAKKNSKNDKLTCGSLCTKAFWAVL